MLIEYRDTDGGSGCIIRASGLLTEAEFTELFDRFHGQDPEKYKKYRYTIADYSAVTKLQLSVAAVRRSSHLAKQGSQINPDAVVALVTNQDLLFGLARMWMILVDGIKWEIETFRSLEEAKLWSARRVEEKYGLTGLTFE